jgi:hypothetical protein
MLWILALKAFYDGSGKAHDPGCRFLNLGALAGTDAGWSGFKARWLEILMKHNAPLSDRGAPYFHSKEAMHNKGGYSAWNTDRVMALVNDLFKVIGDRDRMDVVAISSSIQLNDYKAVKAKIPNLKQPEAISLDWCFGTTLRHPARDSGIELYFDRKENFYPILRKLWKHQGKPGAVWWASYVVGIEEVNDMRDWPEIQAADLLAWLANRYYTTVETDDTWGWQLFRTFLLRSHYHLLFNEEILVKLFNPDGSMRPDVELQCDIKAPAGTVLQLRVE